MAVVKLLEFEAVNEDTFTRWDITGHQLNRPLVSKDLTGTPEAIVTSSRPRRGSSTICTVTLPDGNWHEVRNVSDEACQVLHFFSGVGSLQDLAVEYPDDASE
jgi:hypothetical protein